MRCWIPDQVRDDELMARCSRTLTPAAQAAFLAALRGGALVEAAAAGLGLPLSTLYWRRKRDPVFDLAWSAAARLSRDSGTGRRLRFAAEDKSRFLATLPSDCDTGAAARRIRFHPCTIYRHLGRDPAFARGKELALWRGYDRLGREAEEEAAARAGRLRDRLEPPPEADVRGDDFDSLLTRLDRYTRPDGSIGPRVVRWPAARNVWSFERAIVALERVMRGYGLLRKDWRDDVEPG